MGQDKNLVVRFFSFEQYHNKQKIGSTRLRVHNLLEHWPEAGIYKYGEKSDVMIFQKVYCTYDYQLPIHFPGIKILDTCDPDWWQTPDIHIAETVRGVDAVVVPTKNMQKFLQQMTDKPVVVIKDRFNLDEFPKPKIHRGKAKHAVWFGYAQNTELLKYAIGSLEKRGMTLTVISNEDPMAYRWASNPDLYEPKYKFVKYYHETIYTEIQKGDVCLLPKGFRPEDKFKSENKMIISQLCGVPVVSNSDDLDMYIDAEARNKNIGSIYAKISKEYDCRLSVKEYKELIRKVRKVGG